MNNKPAKLLSHTIIPNVTGVELVTFNLGDSGKYDGCEYTPIIAWIVDLYDNDDAYAFPVGVEPLLTPYAYRLPQGTFLIPDSCIIDSEELLLKHVNRTQGDKP